MVTDGLVFLFFMALSIGLTVLLYREMERETENLPRMGRKEAEHRAREERERYNRRPPRKQSRN